tara:strand:- start:97 stop:579 length:483 start_codon:yes stop_codon:yes gene_type:complete
MSVHYIDVIRQRYQNLGYQPYRWFQADNETLKCNLKLPVKESKLGLLSTSGAYAVGQKAFHYKDDTSIRKIKKKTATEDIHFSHITENYLVNARKDPNCIFPINQLKFLESQGYVKSVANEILSCMGGIYSQRRVLSELAPNVLSEFRRQKVDIALLVPM